MDEIRFRYNKYSEFTLYLLIISGVITGLFIYALIINCSGIAKGPEYGPSYFREHREYAVYLIFGLIPVCMLLPSLLAAKYWGRREEEGSIRFYEDSAILYCHNEEIKIDRGELDIKFFTPRFEWYVLYILKIKKRKIRLCTSVIEWKENKKKKLNLSLNIAMNRLIYYKKTKKTQKSGGKKEKTVYFYGIEIIPEKNTPEIFNDTAYYVDYDSTVVIPEGEFAACLIRERENPLHVVGDLKIDTGALKNDEINEKNLKNQLILAVIELDEKVEL